MRCSPLGIKDTAQRDTTTPCRAALPRDSLAVVTSRRTHMPHSPPGLSDAKGPIAGGCAMGGSAPQISPEREARAR